MTWRTLATEATGSIDAFTTSAESGSASAFVDILYNRFINLKERKNANQFKHTHANLHHHCAFETFFAVASETTIGILTGSIAANSSHNVAFIDVCWCNTLKSISIPYEWDNY